MLKIGKIVRTTSWVFLSALFLMMGMLLIAKENKALSDEGWRKFLAGEWLKGETQVAFAGEGEEIIVEELLNEEEASAAAERKRISSLDARALLVANFIERNDYGKDSPLQPYEDYGRIFVEVADEFGLDFRLLPAIARKESTFCKSNIGRTYYNCFGYGVPASGITEAGKFTSYEEGIRAVAASLKRNYIDKGLIDPIAIMGKYCPPSANGDGTWALNINQWLAEMRYDDKEAIRDNLQNADLTEFVE